MQGHSSTIFQPRDFFVVVFKLTGDYFTSAKINTMKYPNVKVKANSFTSQPYAQPENIPF